MACDSIWTLIWYLLPNCLKVISSKHLFCVHSLSMAPIHPPALSLVAAAALLYRLFSCLALAAWQTAFYCSIPHFVLDVIYSLRYLTSNWIKLTERYKQIDEMMGYTTNVRGNGNVRVSTYLNCMCVCERNFPWKKEWEAESWKETEEEKKQLKCVPKLKTFHFENWDFIKFPCAFTCATGC